MAGGAQGQQARDTRRQECVQMLKGNSIIFNIREGPQLLTVTVVVVVVLIIVLEEVLLLLLMKGPISKPFVMS